MISKLRLNNFRQHEKTVLEFVPGINTIVGRNNSGKSTIPEAIEFALFGAKTLRDSAKSYIRDGASDGSAVVTFDVAGNDYMVGRNSRDAEVRKNGELDAKYKDNVSSYVATIAGVNSVGFRLGHYVRQKELTEFSNLRPGKRHERVEKMLRVHAVDKAIAKLKDEISTTDIELNLLLKQYQDPEAVDNELIDLEVIHESLRFRGVGIAQELEKVRADLAAERALQEAAAVAAERKANLEKKSAELHRRRQTANEARLQLDGVSLALNQLGRVSDEAYAELERKVAELQDLGLQYSEMKALKTELDALGDLELPPQVEAPEAPDRMGLTAASAALQTANRTAEAFKKVVAGTMCPTCLQDVPATHVHDTSENIKELLSTLQAQVDDEREAYEMKELGYKKAKQAYDTAERLRRDVELKRARRDKMLERYVEVTFDESALTELQARLTSARRAREEWLKLDGERLRLESASSELESLEGELIDLDLQLAPLCVEPYDATYLADIEAVESSLLAAHRKQASELAHAEGRILELKRVYNRALEIKDAIGSLSEKSASLKAQRDNFVLFKRHLTAKIRPLLQDVAESLFHKVTKDRYASYQIASDYDISLTTHSGYIRKLSTISGSENDLACLCLRLAIATLRSSKLAGSLGFIILDEISGAFDDERTKQTLEGLLELRDVIPQIINITFKPVEMRYADRLFTVKEVGGKATVTWEDR